MFLAHLVLLVVVLLAPGAVAAQALEQQVKAAFLFRFLSFVEWPQPDAGAASGAASAAASGAEGGAANGAEGGAVSGAPLVIGVLGADDVRAELEQIAAGRAVRRRPVVVQQVKEGDHTDHLHILFVGRGSTAQLRKLAAMPGVLLVAESEGALEHGAIINFVVRDDRVRFEVAPEEAERRGLRIGARMLAVALHVKGGPVRP